MGQASVSLWATSDGVRVSPETGRYLEDRTDIHKDYPTGDYRSANAVWDAGGGRVRLCAARNEFVSFQVVVEADGPASGVRVEFDGLRGPDGAEITGRHVALFQARYAHVTQASTGYEQLSLGPGRYADALVPAPTGEPLRFDIPDPAHGIGAAQRNQTVWVDIYVPRDRAEAPPGAYTGRLAVCSAGGEQTIAVELKVWDFALPDEIHCRGDIYNRTLLEMPPDQELRYYQMTCRHRFQPGVPSYMPAITVDGTDVSIDWTDYDERLRKYLDGSAFTDAHGYWGPGQGVPIQHILLPFDCNKANETGRAWPIPLPPEGPTKEFEAVWAETARQFRAHFDADPVLRQVEKIAFLDGLDESYNEAAYEKMRYYCELLRRGMGKGWFRYRIDGGYSWEAMDGLCDHVDLWICHTAGFDAEKMAHFRRRGVEPWFYGPMIYERAANSACGSNAFTDLDLLTCRGVGWAAWKYRCGYCEWEFDSYWDRPNDCFDPERNWTDAINFRKGDRAFNGSGLLIYRGSYVGLDDPVPSIRLKAHRRGFQDYEYFWLLRQAGCGDDADRLVDDVVHAMPFGHDAVGNVEIWKNHPDTWDAARIQAGEMLHAAAT
ncbi:MAG: glycoside hydrolase domain-containing protein [Planctomycetota bacterium]|jgi:hypothetical protein